MIYLICNQGKESDKMITRNHKNIMKYANIMTNIKDIAKATKQTESQVESAIITLARKDLMAKSKAKELLKDKKSIKFIDLPFGSRLAKPLPVSTEKVKTIYCK